MAKATRQQSLKQDPVGRYVNDQREILSVYIFIFFEKSIIFVENILEGLSGLRSYWVIRWVKVPEMWSNASFCNVVQ